MSGPYTIEIEVTPQERAQIVEALRKQADRHAEREQPGEADRLRGLARRVEKE